MITHKSEEKTRFGYIKKCFLSSIRFLLTVHNLNVTNVEKLDVLTYTYIKKWSEVPKSVNNLIFHMKEGRGIQTNSTLYNMVHCLNHTAVCLKGNKIINAALNNAVETESDFTRKQSIVVGAQEVNNVAVSKNSVYGMMPSFPGVLPTKETIKVTY